MKLIFKNPRTFQRMHEGPLGLYIDSYAAEMREQPLAEIRFFRSRSRMDVGQLPSDFCEFSFWTVQQKKPLSRTLLRRASASRLCCARTRELRLREMNLSTSSN